MKNFAEAGLEIIIDDFGYAEYAEYIGLKFVGPSFHRNDISVFVDDSLDGIKLGALELLACIIAQRLM